MRCGFIGYGNMGSAVVNALLHDGSLKECEVKVYNRTAGRLDGLRSEFPGVSIAASMGEAVQGVDAAFICVHSPIVPQVLAEVRESLVRGVHLITINGGVWINDLEAEYGGPVSKVIPSVTIETGRGFTLISHGRKVSTAQANALESLFSRSSRVKVLPEDQFGICTDLTSCGPGLLAMMMDQLAASGARSGSIDPREAMDMVAETMLGTALVLADRGRSPAMLVERVATRGGITEQGLRVLESELPGTFDRMFAATRRKRAEVTRPIADTDSDEGKRL
ncbi:MAG: pyrroline-5-carboxylate reductase dimerization domain-containing protein [Methanomassiliicoccus sp.]|nr:pyrroline-5-carboxylate reductase dimerization domain-containing protein [Methanomassiliicoccus sp.]